VKQEENKRREALEQELTAVRTKLQHARSENWLERYSRPSNDGERPYPLSILWVVIPVIAVCASLLLKRMSDPPRTRTWRILDLANEVRFAVIVIFLWHAPHSFFEVLLFVSALLASGFTATLYRKSIALGLDSEPHRQVMELRVSEFVVWMLMLLIISI